MRATRSLPSCFDIQEYMLIVVHIRFLVKKMPSRTRHPPRNITFCISLCNKISAHSQAMHGYEYESFSGQSAFRMAARELSRIARYAGYRPDSTDTARTSAHVPMASCGEITEVDEPPVSKMVLPDMKLATIS